MPNIQQSEPYGFSPDDLPTGYKATPVEEEPKNFFTMTEQDIRNYTDQFNIDERVQKSFNLPERFIRKKLDDFITTLKVPQKVLTGQVHPRSTEAIGSIFDLASTFAGIGLGRAQPGTVGVFGGKMAQTADVGQLLKARIYEKDGVSADEIFEKTGWFKGPDNEWRFEISDFKMKLKPMQKDVDNRLGDVVDHPELFRAYPELKDYRIAKIDYPDLPGRKTLGEFDRDRKEITLNIKNTPDESLDTLVHELQHAVQGIEDFPFGAPPEMFTDVVKTARDLNYARTWRDLINRLPGDNWNIKESNALSKIFQHNALDALPPKQIRELATKLENNPELAKRINKSLDRLTHRLQTDRINTEMELYTRLAGETEARTVEARRQLPPDVARYTHPSKTQDVPPERLIGIER